MQYLLYFSKEEPNFSPNRNEIAIMGRWYLDWWKSWENTSLLQCLPFLCVAAVVVQFYSQADHRRSKKKTRFSERSGAEIERRPPISLDKSGATEKRSTLSRKMTVNPMLVQKAVFVKKSNTGPETDNKIKKTMSRFGETDAKNRKGDQKPEDSLSTSEDFNYTLTKIRNINQEDFKAEDIRIMNANSKLNTYREVVKKCVMLVLIFAIASLLLIMIEVWLFVLHFCENRTIRIEWGCMV